ncbi:MAG: tRNA lysidine(34) synthetase TilS [Robiginitomaculum sp.]|nr:tRNA lysidine(34) synthetase TilS [Robiginitomaculum sp.]
MLVVARNPDILLEKCEKHLSANESLVVGFSGGGDSLALLVKLLQLGKNTGRAVHALIVNHRIKKQADAEACQALLQAQELGANAQILNWNGANLVGHAQARTARYTLLAAACRQLGSRHLWLAHTASDQIETFWLRIKAGSGARGLAVMGYEAPFPVWPAGYDLRVLRPLLDQCREQLRDDLLAQGLGWIEDAANTDRQYERVRIRQSLAELQAAGLQTELVSLGIGKFQKLAEIEQSQVEELLSCVVFDKFGFAVIDNKKLQKVDETVLARFLEKIMLGVSGRSRAKHNGRALVATWRKLPEQDGTINGCLLQFTKNEVRIFRDPGAVCGRAGKSGLSVEVNSVGQSVLFDNKWLIVAPEIGTLLPLGNCLDRLTSGQIEELQQVPYPARATLPVLQSKTDKIIVFATEAPQEILAVGAARGIETGTQFA